MWTLLKNKKNKKKDDDDGGGEDGRGEDDEEEDKDKEEEDPVCLSRQDRREWVGVGNIGGHTMVWDLAQYPPLLCPLSIRMICFSPEHTVLLFQSQSQSVTG